MRKPIRRRAASPERKSPLGGGSGLNLPVTNLIQYNKPFDDAKGVTRTPQPLQYIHYIATPIVMTHAGITGTMTVTKPTAATAPTVAAGSLTLGSGDLWSFTIMDGAVVWGQYEFATALSATSATVFDVSGNGRHLMLTVADTAAVCLSGREVGSDYLNTHGFTTSDGATQYMSAVSFGLIPVDVKILALADGSGCCAYVVGGLRWLM